MKKRKLSKETLDKIVLAHVNDKRLQSYSAPIPYTLASGQTVHVFPQAVAFGQTPITYLLGQTYPYHDRKKSYYPVTDLLFTVKSDGKKEPWTRNPKDLQFLLQVCIATRTITVSKCPDGKMQFFASPFIPKEFCDEKEHME